MKECTLETLTQRHDMGGGIMTATLVTTLVPYAKQSKWEGGRKALTRGMCAGEWTTASSTQSARCFGSQRTPRPRCPGTGANTVETRR